MSAMTCLVPPAVHLRASLAEAMADFGDITQMHGSGFWHLGQGVWPDTDERGMGELVTLLRGFGDPARELDDSLVHSDYLWIVDGEPEQVIGFIAIRHALNAFLLEEGGHIGYSVRPARRGQGHATRALAMALDRAVELGIDRALVTCDDDNEPSRRTIERNGGVLEDVRRGNRRYWIDTRGRVTPAGSAAAPA
jgi:predicted acetyltransferase